MTVWYAGQIPGVAKV